MSSAMPYLPTRTGTPFSVLRGPPSLPSNLGLAFGTIFILHGSQPADQCVTLHRPHNYAKAPENRVAKPWTTAFYPVSGQSPLAVP